MLDFRKSSIIGSLRKVLLRLHYPLEVMLTCVRWYVAYPLSLRHIEEMMRECGVFVDHATVHRWAIKMVPVLAAVFHRRKEALPSYPPLATTKHSPIILNISQTILYNDQSDLPGKMVC